MIKHPIAESFAVGRCLSDAVAAVRLYLGPLWLGGLLLTISDSCGSNLPSDIPSMPGSEAEGQGDARAVFPHASRLAAAGLPEGGEWMAWVLAFVVAVALVALVVGVLLFCLHCWVQTGSVRLHENVIVHGSEELAPLFSGRDRFVDMLGWKLLSGLCVSASVLVTAWPGALLAYVGYTSQRSTLWAAGIGFGVMCATPAFVFVALGGFLGDQALVLERRRPIEALRRAWSIAYGNRFPLLWFALVCLAVQLVSVLGVVLCCVGALATVPLGRAITELAKTEGFLVATRGLREAQDFHLWRHLAERDAATVQAGAIDQGRGPGAAPTRTAPAEPPPLAPAEPPPPAPAAPAQDEHAQPRRGYVPVPPPRAPDDDTSDDG